MLLQVLAGGCIGPANPPAAAAAAAAPNGDAHEYSSAAAAVNGSSGAPLTPTRMTRRTASAMASATADGGSSGSSGQFYPPTVIVGVKPNMDLYHEEVFGPVSLFLHSGFDCLASAAQLPFACPQHWQQQSAHSCMIKTGPLCVCGAMAAVA